jgi:outer membrane lipoprotein carrier protein
VPTLRTLLVLPLVAVAATARAQAPATDSARALAALDRAVKAYAAAGSLRASFEQSIRNPLTGTVATSTGTLQQQPPKLLAVTFTKPAGDRIVADGQSLWVYVPSAIPGQVMRLPLGAAGPGGVDVLGQFFENPRARYAVTPVGVDTTDGHATYRVRLVPTSRDGAPFQSATLWLDERHGWLWRFVVADAMGLERTVRITSLSPGAKPDDGAFRFVVPKGVRVVEQPGM